MCNIEGSERSGEEGCLCAQLDTQILEPALQHAFAVDLGFTCREGSAFVVVGTLGEAGALGAGGKMSQ